jgi:hypothetical protein
MAYALRNWENFRLKISREEITREVHAQNDGE